MCAVDQAGVDLGQLPSKVGRLFSKRLLDAETRFVSRFPGSEARQVIPSVPVFPWETWQDWSKYLTDAAQRSILFWDTIRRRGNQYLDHERAGKALGMTRVFMGLVPLALIGGAAESSSAIVMARANKMDLSLGIALGSSIQMALLIAPLLVLAGPLVAGHPLTLAFTRA